VGVGIPEFEADVDAEEPDSPKRRRESLKLPLLLLLQLLYLQLLFMLLVVEAFVAWVALIDVLLATADAAVAAAAAAAAVFLNSFVLYSSLLSLSRRVELSDRLFRLAEPATRPCSMIACNSALPRPLSRLVSAGLEEGGGVVVGLLLRLVNFVVFGSGLELRSSVADAERVAMLKEAEVDDDPPGPPPKTPIVGIADTSR